MGGESKDPIKKNKKKTRQVGGMLASPDGAFERFAEKCPDASVMFVQVSDERPEAKGSPAAQLLLLSEARL